MWPARRFFADRGRSASVSSGPGCLRPVSGGVVFSKLSKLLNQEDALSAPCLHLDFCSPQAPKRGAGMLLVTRRVHYQPICRIRSRALQRQIGNTVASAAR
jgi:hypothetical protein